MSDFRELTEDERSPLREAVDELISEWMGFDVPAEGAEDSESLVNMQMLAESCIALADFVEFFEIYSSPSSHLRALDLGCIFEDELLEAAEAGDTEATEKLVKEFTAYYGIALNG
ncbi:hypothetical protein RMSM_00726 [Rhodopirellula maiorica SM1]|uniref:Uncharacterized protein n=1 Tax=Rhodopirellula maiorica SM1 TaxID=1265738 RepID=M5S857_9BACT|nr:hypothetical protein [Rhodopirellula maiorica]EMI22349.1 hypothetical protein RMSM_00726 [Rhodopirellula maiorica SM1]